MANSTSNKEITISPYKFARLFAIVSLILIILSSIGQIGLYEFGVHLPGTTLFYLDNEFNIPSIFSGLILLTSALTLTYIYYLEKGSPNAKYWLVLACGFYFMSLDEVISIHERLNPIASSLIHDAGGVFTFAWVVPYIIIVVFFGFFFLRFLLSLPKNSRINFIIAGTIYLFGAIGLEMIGGDYYGAHGTKDTLTYAIFVTIEESCEMFGISFFIYSLLQYIQQVHRNLILSVRVV
jgi:hypothetical protein